MTKSKSNHQNDYPDEPAWPSGWRPWTSLVGCFFLMFNSWGLVNGYGTYLSYYQSSLLQDNNLIEFNMIGATQCFFILFLSFIAGRLLDANYSRALLICGSFLVTLGMLSLSLCNGKTWSDGNIGAIWLYQGFICGIGMACFFLSGSAIAATWFKQKKGFAIGIVASGASISGMIYPTMLRQLIDKIGFNRSVQAITGLLFLTCLISIFLATPNPSHFFHQPETWKSVQTWIDTDAFRSPAWRWYTTAISFMFFGFYSVFFNLEKWAADTKVGYLDTPIPGAVKTYILLATMNASSTIGRLSSSYLCDIFGALQVHFIVTLVSSFLCLFLWTFAKDLAATLAFVILFGAFSGSVIGLPPAAMAAVLGPDRQERLGHWTGMMYTVSSVFALTGPVVAANLIVKHENYLTVQVWSGLCLFLSAVSICVAYYYKVREQKQREEEKRLESKRDLPYRL
ncbi:hypothetical protein TWF694_003709 [Orbilia ellipsospora]|uniref:MFS general substrate transporter n=1 Tax=Orbilia ellipsospora TaxID=2528407 RepID=A0AAV9X009_9PEZI